MKKLLLTLVLIASCVLQANAQRFPITVVPQVNSPAPVNFYNYADGTTINSPLRVQLLLSDISISNLQIRLKVSFEGQGIAFESRDLVVGGNPLFIDGGAPLVLRNTELAPYFEFQNLQGINANVYGQTIPEGSYQFCFEVFDFTTGNRLSSKTCATTFIFKNEPPLLNLPLDGTNMEPQPVDNIVFQWTPRHINVSNVEYELSIVEIWDDGVDPQTAFLSSPPVFQTTTRANSFVYGPGQPLLLNNKRYAWQVQAKALQGAEEIGLFKNEGKSEIFWFSKTEPCATPLNVYAEPKGISKINVFWDEDPSVYTEYTIAYREADKSGAQWFTMRTNSGWATVWDLKPNTTYEYKVSGKCKYQYGEYSQPQRISTEAAQDETANYNCGIVPDEIAITNREPIDGILIGDRITAGDFVVTITEIDSESGGRLTGKGYVRVPYFEFARFGVTFNGILVNTDYQLAEGEIVTLYDPTFGEGATMTVDVNTNIGEGVTGDQGGTDNQEVDFVITAVEIDENGAIVITGENGEEAIIPGGRDITITDSEGTPWTVGEDGTITKGEKGEGGAATTDNTTGMDQNGASQISAKGVRIDFEESGYYYFDAAPSSIADKVKGEYKTITVSDGGEYTIPYKVVASIAGHEEDVITAKATFSDNTITKDDIAFKTKDGVKVNATWSGDVATLKLQKKFDYAIEEVLATLKPKDSDGKYAIAGVFNMVHLASQEVKDINVSIVPINTTVSNTVIAGVNEIYNKAGVNFNIKIENPLNIGKSIWDIDGDNAIDVGDSSLLAQYTPEERAINQYYKNQGSYDKNRYYIFVLGNDIKPSQGDIQGFMPLKRQYGFAFNPNNLVKTIAHELGHGVFGLEHPWDTYGFTAGSTNWLMDGKNNGTILNHMDWKKIHAPGLKLYIFQDDEDGEYRNGYLVSKIIQEIKCKYKNNDYQIDAQLEGFIDRATFYDKSWGKESKPFKVTLLKYTEGSPTPVECKIAVGRKKSSSSLKQPPVTYKKVHKVYGYTYEYDMGGVTIWSDFDLLIDSDGSEFIGYLANDYTVIDVIAENDPEGASTDDDDTTETQTLEEVIVTAVSLNAHIKSLLDDDDISNRDFKIIKSIASCEATSLKLDTRFKVIKLMSEKWVINEKKEDLVLDLLSTTKSENYDKILDEFKAHPKVYKGIAEGVDDIFEGAEDNKKRLFDELFTIWSNSKYYKDPYPYHAQNGGSYDDQNRNVEFYREVKAEIESFILENFNSDCLANYKDISIVELLTCMELSSTAKIQQISYEDRKAILEKILKFGSFASSSFSGTYEKPIIRLIKYLPEDFDHDVFIKYLVEDAITIPEGQHGGSVTASIIKLLFDKVNDKVFIFTGDYRKELVEGFIYLKAKSAGIDTSIAEIKKGIDDFDIDEVEKGLAHYSYDYRNILRRLLTTASPVPSFDFYVSLETELEDNNGTSPAVLTIEQTLKSGVTYSGTLSKKEHSPFDLILFLNLSKQPLLSDFSQPAEDGTRSAAMVPAIVAHYASEEGNNQTKSDLIQTAVDVGSLAIPGGQLGTLGRLFYYADKVSSLASISATFNREENPELAQTLNNISMATGVISLGDLASTGYKALLKSKASNLKDLAPTQIAKSLEDQSKEIINIVDNHPQQLNNLLEGGPNKVDELADILEAEKQALGKEISSDQTQVVQDAIDKLRGFKGVTNPDIVRGISKSAFKSSFTASDDLTEQAWKFFKEEKWDELENLFVSNDLNKWNDIIYPPNNGFIDITEVPIPKDAIIDRFGGWYDKGVFNDKGKFVAPQEVPFGQRALPEAAKQSPKQTYKVLKPIPGVKKGKAIPWFGQPGKGIQYQLPKSIDELVEAGFIKRINNTLLENGDGRFIDDILEGDYQNYLTRKSNAGQTARDRLQWKEVRDYWLNDSPLARGNAFNRKAVDNNWYPYHEVHLANGKRLDSYDDIAGEIISRKATDLSDIKLETFESYLKEMKAKYAPGTAINSPKYSPDLDNQVLEGKQILEIPSSNQSYSKIQDYVDLAKKEYDIEIRFAVE